MKRISILIFFAILSASCATGPTGSQRATAQNTKPEGGYLVVQRDFIVCELEAFITLTAARSAITFNASKESLLSAKKTGEFQIGMINELFERVETEDFKNYPKFAAEKFYQCTERKALPITKRMDAASLCLARQDIGFYLLALKRKGRTQAESSDMVKKMYEKNPEGLFPDKLIDATANMVFQSTNTDEDYFRLRKLSFETCLFPEEWKAWWNSQER